MGEKPKTIEEERQEMFREMEKIISELIKNFDKMIEKCSDSEVQTDGETESI